MNILIFSKAFSPDIGGIETMSKILASYFISAGNSVCVVTDSLGSSTDDSEFSFVVVRRPSVWILQHLCQWCDVVLHTNLEARKLWPLLLRYKPLVIGLQTWIVSEQGPKTLQQRLKHSMLKMATTVVACSNSIRINCWPNAVVIPNTYQSKLFRNLSNSPRSQCIVYVGRLVSDKGVDLLIKAYSQLNDTGWTLTIIGSGPELESLTCLADELGVLPFVSFLGPLSGLDLVRVLNQHEIMVVPSRWNEPFGIVALEGLACGCVVLASDGGGLPDAVGNAGMLFRSCDLSDLTARLTTLIQSRSLRDSYRGKARSHLVTFDESVVAEQYLSVLRHASNS